MATVFYVMSALMECISTQSGFLISSKSTFNSFRVIVRGLMITSIENKYFLIFISVSYIIKKLIVFKRVKNFWVCDY